MFLPPASTQTITIDLLSNYLMLQREGEWVNLQIELPELNVANITNATLEYTGGSSVDTANQLTSLSVFSTERIDAVISLGDTNSIVTGSSALDTSFAELLLDPDNIFSIRTSGTAGSWLVVEQMKLVITAEYISQTSVPMPCAPSFRYRGNKEGSKFMRYAHEMAGACTDILINKKEVPYSDTSLMSISTEIQHLRRILDWRIR